MTLMQIDCRDANANLARTTVAKLTVWVQANRVKPTDIVTFKETGDMQWVVTKCYQTRIVTEDIQRGWGLDLPKSQRTER